jgi:hypothetical protein
LDKDDEKNAAILAAIQIKVSTEEKAKFKSSQPWFTPGEIKLGGEKYYNSKWYNEHRVFDLGPDRCHFRDLCVPTFFYLKSLVFFFSTVLIFCDYLSFYAAIWLLYA